jgi:hypothetical protein
MFVENDKREAFVFAVAVNGGVIKPSLTGLVKICIERVLFVSSLDANRILEVLISGVVRTKV